MSDFRFVPAARFGEESFWDEGLELFPASLADDLVPAILLRGCSDANVTRRFKSKNRLSLTKAGALEIDPRFYFHSLRHNSRNMRAKLFTRRKPSQS